MLAGSRPRPILVHKRGAGGADGVELVVFAMEPPLAAAGVVDLVHLLALALHVPDKPGAVVAGALDRPESIAGSVPVCEADGVRVAACAGGCCPLRNHRARPRFDDRDRVLVAMGVGADHVIQLVCEHPTDLSDSPRSSSGAVTITLRTCRAVSLLQTGVPDPTPLRRPPLGEVARELVTSIRRLNRTIADLDQELEQRTNETLATLPASK